LHLWIFLDHQLLDLLFSYVAIQIQHTDSDVH